MKRIAIIPARGGSKRIPRKNIKSFCGKPIIAYSIEAAINSGLFDVVMVSTDDEEIAEVAILHGAEVPQLRSAKNSDDQAHLAQVLEEHKEQITGNDTLVCLLPTAPLIETNELKNAVTILESSDADTVVPVVKFSFPIQRAFKIDGDQLSWFQPEYALTRSQDLEVSYHDAGSFYVMKVDSFLKQHSILMKKSIPVILDEMKVQDIDNEEDWRIAELKYKMLNNG